MALAVCGMTTVEAGAAQAGPSVTSVPEPNGYTLALMALTLGCVAVLRRKPK
jgi:hypothetical protein